MDKIKFKSKSSKGKGFYIALSICLIAIGVATWTTYSSVSNFVKTKNENSSKSFDRVEEILPPEITEKPAGNTLTGVIEEKDNVEENEVKATDAKESEETNLLFVYPVGKEVLKPFSDNNLLYSKTFKDWRTHNGIDFLAEQGEKVRAITNGVVKDIYDDPSLGMTMVIEHDGGFIAYYSGLGNTTLIEKDAQVSSGQEIASINDVPCEICDDTHLHLSIQQDDRWINPMDILENAK